MGGKTAVFRCAGLPGRIEARSSLWQFIGWSGNENIHGLQVGPRWPHAQSVMSIPVRRGIRSGSDSSVFGFSAASARWIRFVVVFGGNLAFKGFFVKFRGKAGDKKV